MAGGARASHSCFTKYIKKINYFEYKLLFHIKIMFCYCMSSHSCCNRAKWSILTTTIFVSVSGFQQPETQGCEQLGFTKTHAFVQTHTHPHTYRSTNFARDKNSLRTCELTRKEVVRIDRAAAPPFFVESSSFIVRERKAKKKRAFFRGWCFVSLGLLQTDGKESTTCFPAFAR